MKNGILEIKDNRLLFEVDLSKICSSPTEVSVAVEKPGYGETTATILIKLTQGG